MTEPSDKRFSDGEYLRRYLLGDLSDDEEAVLETAYFSDTSLLARVELAEHDLMDEYASNLMAPADRGKFERTLLATPEGQAELATARALRSAASPVVRPGPPLPASPRRASRGWLAWAAAIALLAVGIPVAWQFRPEPERAVEAIPSPATTAPLSPPAAPPTAEPTTVVATLVLTVDLVRSEGRPPTLTASPDTTHVDLVAPADLSPSVGTRIRIETAEGREVWSGPIEAPDKDGRLRVRVPVSVLGPGDYLFKIVGSTRKVSPDAPAYYFRIRAR